MASQNIQDQIIIYEREKGQPHIGVRMQGETVWLTQAQLVELFQSSKANISEHIKHIFEERELERNLVVRKFRTTASDDEAPRSDDRGIFSTSLTAKSCSAVRPGKLSSAGLRPGFSAFADKPFAGLTSFKAKQPTQTEAMIAKNFLKLSELKVLNNLVSAYFDLAEISALEQKPMKMKDYIRELDNILNSTGRRLLPDSGKISHAKATEKATLEYRKYKVKNLSEVEKSYLDAIKVVEKNIVKKSKVQ